MAKKELVKILQSQGFGSRKECTNYIKSYGILIEGVEHYKPKESIETNDLEFEFNGKKWVFFDKVYILMNKPKGTECSRMPTYNPSVLGKLPNPLIQRGVQTVGRLDTDTSGALLLTDDGNFNHALTSPKAATPKIYRVNCKHPISEADCQKLLDGVLLNDEKYPISAQGAKLIDEKSLFLTLIQGKYHQVKRMIAAVSNRVESLHRTHIGPFNVDDLEPGEWRYLTQDEINEWI